MVADDGKAYYCNCVYGDCETGYVADARLVSEACPMLKADEFPEGWVYHYLGFGNNLVYRAEYDGEYCRLLGESDNPGHEYQQWLGIAVKLCGKQRGEGI